MAYSNFTILELKTRFNLSINEAVDLFLGIPENPIPATLQDILRRYLPLAINLNTKKARSELIIAPVLTELKLLYHDQMSLFSGYEFNIDKKNGLKGRCDYILSRNSEQLVLTAPVCVLVEAKNENIIGGIAQCLAEMVAALIFNATHKNLALPVYGVVTTGMAWRFLKLDNLQAYVDSIEYSIQSPRKIFSILKYIIFNEA